MPRYEVEIPGRGKFEVESPTPLTDEQAYAAVAQQLQAGKVEKPASGILAALGKGAESLISSTRAGVKGIYAPEEAVREGRAREEDIGRRYADQVSLEKVKEVYAKRGLLPAAGEVLSQVPYALAEQAPNIAATLGSARLGAMAGAPLGLPGIIGGGLAGAVIPSFFQQAGGNLQRQAEEARARGEPAVIDRAAAYGAAAPQAALDVASTFIPLGRSLVGKALGPNVVKLLEKGAEESAERLAKETLLKTLGKGTAIGALAEVPTEVAQQMIERAQAGLPLLTEDAFNEYGETAYQGILLSLIGAAGRVVDRSQARDKMEQRAVSAQREQRRAERLAAAEKEEQQAAFKETDEYALQIGSQYDALQKQYDDLGAQLKQKLPPGAPIADREAFKGLKDQRAALKEQLQQLSAEYNRVRPRLMALQQQQAQQEAAAQQQALAEQQARMQEEQQAGPMQQLTLPGMEPQVLTEEAAAPAEEPVDYAAQANNLRNYLDELRTKAQTTKVLSDKLALGEEYTRIEKALKEAEDLAKQAPKPVGKQLELLRKKMEVAEAEGDIPAQVKLAQKLQDLGVTDLSQIGAQQTLDLGVPFMLPPGETKAQFSARVYKPGAEDIETQEREYLEQQRREEEQRLEDAQREQRLVPETSALRRIGKRAPVIIGEKDIYGPTADRIIESIIERQPPTFTGQIAVGEGIKSVERGDSLRAQLAYARVTNNKERIEELRKRLADLQEPETEVLGSAVELGAIAKKVGVEGTQTPAAMAANRVTRLSQAQLTAFDRLADFVNTVREREVPSSEARQKTLEETAYRLRDIVVGLALNEADARLAQMSKPALTTTQQMQLVAGLERPLNELIQRGALAFMPPVQYRAQMRGSRIVMGAQEEVSGKRLFGSFNGAANTIRGQMRSVIDKAIGTKALTAKGAPYKASVLRIQFAVTAKERTDAQLFKQAYDNATEAETAQLERIEQSLPYIENNTVRESIMDSVRDKADGKPLELDQRAAVAVESLRRAVIDEGAQAELFPGASEKGVTRATPGRFQRFLDSREVAKMREQAAEAQKRADYMVKMSEGIQARMEKERKAADDYVNKLTEGKAKTPIEAAQRALETAVDKNVEAARIADEINKRRMEERTRIAAMVAELDRAKTLAQKKVDELAELMESASQFMLNEPKNTAAFAAAKAVDGQLRRAINDFQAVVTAHTNATALYNKILEAHASDTIDNALIREGSKAQKRIDEARQALSDARQAEADAKRAVESIQKEQRTETEEQKRKRLFLYPSEGITRVRVFRDTTVPSVAEAVKAQRGIIAKAEENYENARLSGNERGMRAASLQVETAYRNLYRKLDNAPLRQAEFATKEEIAAFEAYETAQRAFAQAELNASFAEKGLPAPQMPPRRKLGPVTAAQSAAPTTMRTGTAESRAGLTTRGQPSGTRLSAIKPTVAAETKAAKAAPKSVLEQIAEKRAELRTVNEQLAYIDANKKGPVRAGKSTLSPKQAETKRTVEARKRELLADLKELGEQQRSVVAEASLESKAQKILRTETKRLAQGVVKKTGVAPEEEKPAMLRGVEVESPDLTPTQVESLRQNDVVAALEDIANDPTASELNRAVARRLSTLLDGTKVEIVDGLKDDQGNPASGSGTSKLIRLDRQYGLSQEVLLHEGVHAAVERVIQADESSLTREQLIAKRELKALFASIQNDSNITSKNAKSSLSEFVAEALSNSNLQRQLSQKKWKLSDAWKGIKSIILRLLGVKNPETMLGATLAAVDTLMIPSSQRMLAVVPAVEHRLAQKDIAALDDGSNSMKEFAAQFPQFIRQKDRTPEDVDRIGKEYLADMANDPLSFIPEADPNKLDYTSDTIMSDGKVFNRNNPLHLVEATPATFAALEAQKRNKLKFREAVEITNTRKQALYGLIKLLEQNGSYTWPEQALVAKAASKYAVVATPEGRLRLAEIAENNRHPVAVVSKEAANAVIEELRKGKPLKAAFLDGLQRNADENVQRNSAKNGWQKFDQVKGSLSALETLYTDEEINIAWYQTGYDLAYFADNNELIEQLIADGLLPDRTDLLKTAISINKLEQAAVDLNSGCAGTSWCTGANVSTARDQIKNGDFYVYYKNGKPEVAVLMAGQNDVDQIRGNTPQQWLTQEQQDIAENFLKDKNFKNSAKYLEETNRKTTLTKLFKDGPSIGTSKIFDAVDEFAPLITELNELFKFPIIDGYAGKLRPAPSEKVLKTAEKLVRESFALDRNAGYFYHDFIEVDNKGQLHFDRMSTSSRAESVKLQSLAFDVKNVKAAAHINVKQTGANLASLEEVKELFVLSSDVKMPSLLRAKTAVVFEDTTLTVGKQAVIDNLEGYATRKFLNLELIGGRYIKFVKGLNGAAKTAPYISVSSGSNSLLSRLAEEASGIFYAAAKANNVELYFYNKTMDELAKAADVSWTFKDGQYKINKPRSMVSITQQPDGSIIETKKSLFSSRLTQKRVTKQTQLEVGFNVLNSFIKLLPEKTKSFFANDFYPVDIDKFSFADHFTARVYELNNLLTEKEITQFIKKLNEEKLVSYGSTLVLPEAPPVFKTPAKVADAPPVEEATDTPERPRYAPVNPALRDAVDVTNRVVSKNESWWDGVRSNSIGTNKLAFETAAVDRFAPFEKLAKYQDRLKGTQMMYYLRMYDQRMNYAAMSAGNGALDLVEVERPDGEKEFLIESVEGPNLRNVVLILRDAKNIVGDVDAAGRLFTLYLAAKRAERVGFSKLDFSGQVTEQELKDAVRQIESVPKLKEIFEDARAEYNAYNRNQVRFAEKAGVFSKEFADKLLSSNDYIPWYRERNGAVELWIGGETPFKLGNVKNSPHLEQLIGGDKPILDFMVSSVQNTNMLVDMSLRNISTRNAVFELVDMGGAIITPKPTTGPDVVKFKHKGEDRYAILQTERLKIGGKEIDTGIPAELVVKGMEGIPLQVTGVMRAIGFPTKVLRKFVTLNPSQMIRQVFRDSAQAFIAAGSNDVPVLGALKEIRGAAQETLTRRGITGGQVFTGTTEDIAKVMRDITKGGVNVNRLIAGLESMAANVDAGTRASQYNSYINQGMSQMEATLLSLESMNFNKRGASPSVHAANNLYAFFNAQVQGLNVLYKAMFGQLTPAERARVKEKLITRGAMLFAASLAYAHLMQDDEAYKNAPPAEKYGYWFIRIPGFDEPMRISIPYELGYIFKALPEALYNALMAKAGADEAKEAAISILRNVIPGASSMFIPQALKPSAEIAANYSFFLQRPLLSAKEQALLPEAQYRDNTTELAKLFGGATGTSPIKFEALISGYFGGLGLVLLGAASLPFVPSDSPEKATKRLSDLPVIGDFFQPNDGSWVLNNTFDTLEDARKTQRTFNELLNRGQKAEAKALLERRSSDYARAELEGYFRHEIGELTKLETAIKASDKTADEKRELLNQVKQAKIKLALLVRDASDKTKLQASLS